MIKLATHRLRISDPEQSLLFYQQKLGMELIEQIQEKQCCRFFLGFDSGADQPAALLELIHDRSDLALSVAPQPSRTEGYWKISIAVDNLDMARQRLLTNQVSVGDAFEVPNVAYLCHLADPDGYCIELIQRSFRINTPDVALKQNLPLGSHPTFLLSTIRVKDPKASLEFYRNILGMRLLSRQQVSDRQMTLYFLAFTEERLPVPDIEAVENREWLWKRQYTQLELQHIWGTENQDEFTYRTDQEGGFGGLTFEVPDAHQLDTLINMFGGPLLADPDGYRLYLQSADLD